MRKAFIIARKDIGETLRSRSTYFTLLILLAITSPYISGLYAIVNNTRAGGLEILKAALTSYLNTVVSTLPLTIAMLVAGPFSSFSMLLEKAKHNFESLLSTSVSLREVWLGKSLSVFLPAL
jgi:ABC-type Na+ efflux pump permease subunit